jgi:hypothetical protein
LDEIRETAKRTFVDRDEELAGLGNDTLNQSRMGNPQQLALRVEREKEADKKLKEMLKDMTTCLENVGFVNPMNKVYKLVKDLDYFPLAAAILTLNALDQLKYDTIVFNLTRQKKEFLIDGPHFIIGLITMFRQFHHSQFKKYILYLVHFVKTNLSASKEQQMQTKLLNLEAVVTMTYLEELLKFEGTSRELVT